MNTNIVLAYIIARGKESSTWRGLIMFVFSVAGWQTTPDRTEAIILLATTICGAIGVFTKDHQEGYHE